MPCCSFQGTGLYFRTTLYSTTKLDSVPAYKAAKKLPLTSRLHRLGQIPRCVPLRGPGSRSSQRPGCPAVGEPNKRGRVCGGRWCTRGVGGAPEAWGEQSALSAWRGARRRSRGAAGRSPAAARPGTEQRSGERGAEGRRAQPHRAGSRQLPLLAPSLPGPRGRPAAGPAPPARPRRPRRCRSRNEAPAPPRGAAPWPAAPQRPRAPGPAPRGFPPPAGSAGPAAAAGPPQAASAPLLCRKEREALGQRCHRPHGNKSEPLTAAAQRQEGGWRRWGRGRRGAGRRPPGMRPTEAR